MPNETERNPKLRRVIVTYSEQGVMIENKNVNWGMAVSMLIDALQGARIQEIQERAKKAKKQIVTGDPSQIPNLRS